MPADATGVKGLLGPRLTVVLRCLRRGLPLPRWGNLRRPTPFSSHFGFDRGTPVDRHYLDRFLREHAAAITGDVLEVQAPDHARRYGHALARVESVDILPQHAPTWCTDLADASIIPSAHYDCFLLPNTLSALRDLEGCLAEARRVVRPGGTILATGATFVPFHSDLPDYWRLGVEGWTEVTRRVWRDCEVSVRAYGNSLAATAALLGLAAEELTPAELDRHDPRYPVLMALVCRVPAGA